MSSHSHLYNELLLAKTVSWYEHATWVGTPTKAYIRKQLPCGESDVSDLWVLSQEIQNWIFENCVTLLLKCKPDVFSLLSFPAKRCYFMM